MRKLVVFNHVSLDGYFVDAKGDMSFAHRHTPDPEWDAFVAGNASGGGLLVFGRVTYELMAGFWPTPAAAASMPAVAERMNDLPKIVFTRTLVRASWNNTTLVKGDPAGEIRRMKRVVGEDMTILGSGSLVAQLTPHRLIDEYLLVVNPVVLGRGRTLFEGVTEQVPLRLTGTRTFGNGNVLLTYRPMA
jgi:dihydrofolate reductase